MCLIMDLNLFLPAPLIYHCIIRIAVKRNDQINSRFLVQLGDRQYIDCISVDIQCVPQNMTVGE